MYTNYMDNFNRARRLLDTNYVHCNNAFFSSSNIYQTYAYNSGRC